MDKNAKWVMEEKIKRTIENFSEKNIDAYYAEDEKNLLQKVNELINHGDTVAVGGSMTLFETGIIDTLRNGKYVFLDRYASNLTKEDIESIYRKSFSADAYFTSSNAITENGELYNVDGTGNRVAAMIYGPHKVIVIVGINKIVKNVDEAIERNRRISAPANAKRLNRNTPCAKLGYCTDCNSPDRICRDYVVIKNQREKGRIHVIIVGKELGY